VAKFRGMGGYKLKRYGWLGFEGWVAKLKRDAWLS
jgi:hypothetical protein